ncbi:MAG TPA: polysaccharide biosynthesis tyrosine autokinase [Syntrophales bacterium]|nr:polysaccharide biosynthesis tyrosine autokinase [Syntrophales bacterium]
MQLEMKNVNLQDYLRVVLKHRWTIATVFAVVFVSVLIFTFTATPIYMGTARVIIEKENPKVVSMQEVMTVDSSGLDYYQTQYKIIESRSVAREVVRRLKLDQHEEFVPKPKEGLFYDIVYFVPNTIGYIASLFKTDEAAKKTKSDSAIVNAFLQRVKVTPIRNSRLVDIGFEAKSPYMSAKIANTLAKAYIDNNLETKLRATQDAVAWLEGQIVTERKKVEEAEQALLRYKEQKGIVTDFSTDVETITAQKLAEINKQVVEATSRRVEAETRYRQAADIRHSPEKLDSVPDVIRDELIRDIKKQEVEIQKRMSELSKRYGARHPQILALQEELNSLQSRKANEIGRIVDSLYNEYKVALAKEYSLKNALSQQKGESLAMNVKAIDYNVLKRQAESSREMYDILVKRFKETSITEDIKTGNIRIVDLAEIPKSPVKPKKAQNLLLGLIVGLALGVGLAFFLEYLDNTIKVPDDIKNILKLPYLGPVPAIAAAEGGAVNGEKNPADDLVSHLSPKSTASEAYRGIRTSILFSSAEQAPQVLIISSSGPREGKTITSANIAITMAQAGNRVVILDCDMRRPRVHKIFSLSRDRGMSNLLVGNDELDNVVLHTDIPNLDVIPSGPIPPNPSEVLSSQRMADLIEVLRGRYDRIIIDTPPITAVTDAVILSKVVDGVVLIVRAGVAHRELVRNAVEQLRQVNAHILGAVLNGVDMGRDSYYYYQYYYYYYGEDGERKKKTRTRKKMRSRYYGADKEGRKKDGDSAVA